MDDDENFIAGGATEDPTITPAAPRPIVVFISRLSYYKWAKQLDDGYEVGAVKFRQDGQRAVVVLNGQKLLIYVLESSDGGVLKIQRDDGEKLKEATNSGILYRENDMLYLTIRR